MNCPKCNQENAPEAKICSACGSNLLQPSAPPHRPDVKTSKLATSSCYLAVVAVVFFLLGRFLLILDLCGIVLALLAVVLGIAGLVCIEKSAGRLTGRAFAAIGIAIPVAGFALGGGYTFLKRTRSTAYRLYCGTNLSGIGKAMMIYANDYEDELPRAGGPGAQWGATADFRADLPAQAFAAGRASISANFFFLVKYAEVEPRSFICIGDEGASIFKPAKYKVRKKNLGDLWDFGPDPSKHCSYTYHLPYGKFPLKTSSRPGMAVAADRNPWLDTHGKRARPVTDWTGFDPNGDRESVKRGNAITHMDDGQNILYVDGHAAFWKDSICGQNLDNIYTSQNADDIKKGALPTMTSQPANRTDSLLLHDPPKGATK